MITHCDPLPSVLDAVGETPLVAVQAAPDAVPVYAKLESFDPGASVKDRIGTYMLETTLERGDLEPDGTIVEPTAGNTGIGLAIAANLLDVEAVFVAPERFSVEKQQLMRALGVEVVNTPTDEGIEGANTRARDLAAERGGVVPQQFSNPLDAEAHYATTAPETDEALERVGAVVAGCGTAGTLMGVARYFREREGRTSGPSSRRGRSTGAFWGRRPTTTTTRRRGSGRTTSPLPSCSAPRSSTRSRRSVGVEHVEDPRADLEAAIAAGMG